ncbi:MAG: hypothetical protein IKD72_10500 [Clostridia bacterium]|nr:hypothetical protein [Clostridia bacterium]
MKDAVILEDHGNFKVIATQDSAGNYTNVSEIYDVADNQDYSVGTSDGIHTSEYHFVNKGSSSSISSYGNSSGTSDTSSSTGRRHSKLTKDSFRFIGKVYLFFVFAGIAYGLLIISFLLIQKFDLSVRIYSVISGVCITAICIMWTCRRKKKNKNIWWAPLYIIPPILVIFVGLFIEN